MKNWFLLLLGLLILGCQKQSGPFDFELLTTRGLIDTREWRGKNIIVFFGFTHCPHICPTVFKTMNRIKREDVKIVFISVDHYRDNVQTMLKNPMIGDHIYAGSGTPEQLQAIAQKFETTFSVRLNKDREPMVDHVSHVFLIDRSGQRKEIMDYDSTPEAFLAALEQLEHFRTPPQQTLVNWPVQASNTSCDLNQGPCSLRFKGHEYTLEFKHLPIRDDAYQTLILTTSKGALRPLLADLTGVELNMGLIRPRWKQESQDKYSTSFGLPFCELPSMDWRLRILLSDNNSRESLVEYSFKTRRY